MAEQEAALQARKGRRNILRRAVHKTVKYTTKGLGRARAPDEPGAGEGGGSRAHDCRPEAHEQLLVTTDDSRVRLYQTRRLPFDQLCKFKGLKTELCMICARFSPDGRFVMAGSENGQVFIWSMAAIRDAETRTLRNTSSESFQVTFARDENDVAIATAAVFAPFAAVSLAAAASGVHFMFDDIRDLENAVIATADFAGKLSFFMRAPPDADGLAANSSPRPSFADSQGSTETAATT